MCHFQFVGVVEPVTVPGKIIEPGKHCQGQDQKQRDIDLFPDLDDKPCELDQSSVHIPNIIVENDDIMEIIYHTAMQKRLKEHRSALRPIDPSNKEDMERILDIEKKTSEIMIGNIGTSPEEIRSFAEGESDRLIYGVSGSVHVIDVPDEVGKLQGWVQIYRVKETSTREQVLARLNIPKGKEPVMLEVSYAKYEAAKGGQMSSALKQLLYEIYRNYMLLINGRIEEEVIVIASIDTGNDPSSHVAESAGFKKNGSLELKTQEKPDDLYILDWNNYKSADPL
jgi:hypothetical protein